MNYEYKTVLVSIKAHNKLDEFADDVEVALNDAAKEGWEYADNYTYERSGYATQNVTLIFKRTRR